MCYICHVGRGRAPGTGWSPDLMSQLSRAEASWRGVLGAQSLLLLPYLLPLPPLPAVVCTLLPLSLGPLPLFLPLRFLLPQSPLSWNHSFLSSMLLRNPSAYHHLLRVLLFLFITSRCNWAGLCGASPDRPLPRTLCFSSSLKYPHSSTWCSFLHHSLLSGGWLYCAGPADPALVQ